MRAIHPESGFRFMLLMTAGGIAAGVLPFFLKPMMVLGIGFGLVLSVLVFRNPRIGIFLIAVTIPLETVGRIGSITSALPLTIPKIFTLLTLIAWLVHLALGKMRFRRLPWMYLLFGFLAAAILSLIGASELKSGYEAVLRLSSTVVFFFLVVQLVDTMDLLRWCLAAFLVACTVASSYSLIQRYLPGSTFEFRYGWEEESAKKGGVEKDIVERKMLGVVKRSSGFSTHSILLALNITLLLAPIAAFMGNTSKRDVLSKLFWLAVLAVLIASMLVTYARTGFVILLFSVLLMFWRGLIRITAGKLIAAILMSAILVAALPDKYADRVLSFRSYTTTSASVKIRLDIAGAAMRQFLDHPLTGVGYGNKYGVFDYFTTYRDKKHAVTPHNAYVQVASQVGLLGLIPLCMFFRRAHVHIRRATARYEALGRQDLVRLGIALNVSLIVFLFSGFVLDLFDKGMPHCWLITGLCGAYAYLGQSREDPSPDTAMCAVSP